jgi:hypothetical protein
MAIALQRGIDDRPLQMVPILIDDCELPSLIQNLLVADFRVAERYEEALDLLIRRLGLPDHPLPDAKAQGLTWPLPAEAFAPVRILKLRIAFYDGSRFALESDSKLVTGDSAFVAQIPWQRLATDPDLGSQAKLSLRIVHYESRSWLKPDNKLRDAGIRSGEHLICVVGNGMSVTLERLLDEFSHVLSLQASSGAGGVVTEQPPERALLDDVRGLVEVGRIADAKRVLKTIQAMNPDNALAWYYGGRCHQQDGEFEAAIASFRRATELRPPYPAAVVEVGFCLNELGRPLEALEQFRRALELDPEMDAALINSGFSYELLGDLDRALKCYSLALDRAPLNPYVRQNKGSVLLSLGRFADAAECFRDVLRLAANEQLKARAREGLKRCGR